MLKEVFVRVIFALAHFIYCCLCFLIVQAAVTAGYMSVVLLTWPNTALSVYRIVWSCAPRAFLLFI